MSLAAFELALVAEWLQEDLRLGGLVLLVIMMGAALYFGFQKFWVSQDSRFEGKADPPLGKQLKDLKREVDDDVDEVDKRLTEEIRTINKHLASAATKDEMNGVASEIKELRESVDTRFVTAASLSSKSREKMYESIRDLEQKVAAISKENDIQSAQLSEINRDVKQILQRLPQKS